MKTVIATIAGIVTSFLVIMLTEMIGMKLFPMKTKIDPNDIEALRNLIQNIPLPALVTIIIGHGLGMFLGTVVGHKVEPKSMVPFLIVFLFMLISTISNLAMIPHPMWFMVSDVLIVIVAALAAWKVLDWK